MTSPGVSHGRSVVLSGRAAFLLARGIDADQVRERLAGRFGERDLALAAEALAALREEGGAFIADVRREVDQRSSVSAGGRDSLPREAPVATSTAWTTDQAASRIGVTPRRVRQLAATGELPATRAGTTWLFDAAAIDRYLNEKD